MRSIWAWQQYPPSDSIWHSAGLVINPMLQLQQVAFWSFFQPCKWFFFFVFACDLLKIWIQTWIHVSCWPEASYKCKLCDKCETNEKDMSLLKWLFMRSSLLISYKSMKGSITLSNRLMAYLNVCWGVCVKLWPTKGRRVGIEFTLSWRVANIIQT